MTELQVGLHVRVHDIPSGQDQYLNGMICVVLQECDDAKWYLQSVEGNYVGYRFFIESEYLTVVQRGWVSVADD